MSDTDPLALLDLTAREFRSRLAAIGPDQWSLPTPCDEWDVRGLVNHVVAANRVTVVMMEGGSADEAIAGRPADELGDDPLAAFDESVAAQRAAFAEPGALHKTCRHVVGELPAAMVLGMRTGDMTLHTWDLARAVGGDEVLRPELVEAGWSGLEPIAEVLPQTGFFGAGPSGDVGPDAPLQDRLLDLSGRRP